MKFKYNNSGNGRLKKNNSGNDNLNTKLVKSN